MSGDNALRSEHTARQLVISPSHQSLYCALFSQTARQVGMNGQPVVGLSSGDDISLVNRPASTFHTIRYLGSGKPFRIPRHAEVAQGVFMSSVRPAPRRACVSRYRVHARTPHPSAVPANNGSDEIKIALAIGYLERVSERASALGRTVVGKQTWPGRARRSNGRHAAR